MLLSHVEKILNQDPKKHFTITEIVDILLLMEPYARNKKVLEAKIINKIIKNKNKLSFSVVEKNGIIYLYSRQGDILHRLNRKVPDTPFFNNLRKLKIKMTIVYGILTIIGFTVFFIFE